MLLCTSCAYMKMSSGMRFLMICSGPTSPRRFLIFTFSCVSVSHPSLGPHHFLKWKTAPSGVSDHQDVSMNPRSMKENKTKQKNFHCWSVVFTFYMSVLFSHPPAELTASALKLQRSLFYISVLLLAASRRFVADWPGCFQGKGGYSGQGRWRGGLWYLCTWWQEEDGGGGVI